ncbi:MAG: phosphonate ABC transporter, permease protein PhnE, partial [Acidimicrobiales bacterium]
MAGVAGATPEGIQASIRPPLDRRRTTLLLVGVALAGGAVWGWVSVGMSVTALLAGLGDMRALLERMIPPRFVEPGRIVGLAIETFFIAYLGTFVSVVLATPLAFLAARNTTPHPVAWRAARAVIVVCRAIPDVVFALIFVRAVGIGPLPGVLAIGLHSIGMVGKLYADSIEQIDEGQREAVLATGATPGQAIATGVVPQVLPAFIGTALYRLDINLRISVILGLVGAGGIGFELQNTLRSLIYDRAMGIVVVIMALVICVEFLSAAVRHSIIDARGTSAAAPFDRERLRPPWARERVVKTGYLALFAAGLATTFLAVDVSPLELLASLSDVWRTTLRLFPPDFSTARSGIVGGMTETVAIGLVATTIGLVLTIPLGFLSARNVAPNRGVY